MQICTVTLWGSANLADRGDTVRKAIVALAGAGIVIFAGCTRS